ncbi:MAG: nuclear transport factor 2 family protein [Acidobacteriota bacterium]|nr:nuclear transport factor 2 family protein [Acidobacteriota bacterium]
MRKQLLAAIVLCCLVSVNVPAGEMIEAETAIDTVLTQMHQAASDANGDLYFSLFADNLVFMGTDAGERWSVEELKAFAEPYFSQGRGWTYTKKERHIFLEASGQTAWFDEMLWNEKYGSCRGTGVLVLVDGSWRISQYNLSIPMPNDLAAEFTSRIKQFEGEENR